MSRRMAGGTLVLLLAGTVLLGLVALPVLMLLVSMGSMSDQAGPCPRDGPTRVDVAPVSAATADALNEDQRTNAAEVVAQGYRLGVPRRGILVALAVAHQESRFVNYANDGLGSDLSWLQVGIEGSLALPHESVGTDHGSLGIFQQQWPWWGSMEELMDPAASAQKFYEALLAVPGWERLPVTVAGQAVQRSAFPDAYADDVPLAQSLLDDPGMAEAAGVSAASFGSGAGADCQATQVPPGTATYPLPAGSGFTDVANWGASGTRWSRGHTGTDLSAACGTPVLAATGGTVIVRTDQPWSGPWLVQVSTGVGRLTTWYAHLQSLDVVDGQEVRAGDQIGQVGDLGNSSGCHLHFEVHPRGGTIYEDGVDPTSWLRRNVGQELDGPDPPAAVGRGFVLATFNVLGHSHTAAGGNKPGWDRSWKRMRRTVRLLDRQRVDVVGLQELQPAQAHALRVLAGSAYEVHSPPGDTENSIAFRRSRWKYVAADTVEIPYFDGRTRRMPVLRLRDRTTNLDSIFVNVHNPADTRRFPRQARHRAEAVRREVALVRDLRERYEIPVFLTGDLNDRRDAFCRLTAGSLMTASAGGSHRGDCRPPPRPGIDWIFTAGGALEDHRVVSESLTRGTSDHPLVLTRAQTSP